MICSLTIDHLNNALDLGILNDRHTENVSCCISGHFINIRIKAGVGICILNVQHLKTKKTKTKLSDFRFDIKQMQSM